MTSTDFILDWRCSGKLLIQAAASSELIRYHSMVRRRRPRLTQGQLDVGTRGTSSGGRKTQRNPFKRLPVRCVIPVMPDFKQIAGDCSHNPSLAPENAPNTSSDGETNFLLLCLFISVHVSLYRGFGEFPRAPRQVQYLQLKCRGREGG